MTLIARRLRQERKRRGWTLEQLAAQAQVSRAMISRIERGEANPSATLLVRLGDALGQSLSALMSEPPAPQASALRRLAEQPQWVDPDTGYVRRMVSPTGVADEVEIIAVDLPAGAQVRFAPTARLRYDQQVLLTAGRLRVQAGSEWFELAPGDCLRMATDGEHGFHNPGTEPARYLVVARGVVVRDPGRDAPA
ncbi:helix-turn-helix domain-containing protein [Ideonella livida]|uniref:Helix-turn-helix transcriptional regulator n=1 Tax=Ideonella livida TaxID=2707176 RepID=A0A7C9TKN7_9BURK|nr:XRE family transcriptional regulator [Ideonella livida]NDY90446.1 helix-turn-helix transcriptional regulator [Ideonella livida]